MSEPVKHIFRFILFLFLQAMVFNHMPPLHRFITPYIYFLFLLWIPFYISRSWLLAIGFMLGFSLDLFTYTPGLHASAALLIAYLRPFLINLMVPKDTKELTLGSPSFTSMGKSSYMVYVTLLTLFHHTWLVFLEWMTFGNFLYFIGKVFFSTLVSIAMIFVTELLFRPLSKKRN